MEIRHEDVIEVEVIILIVGFDYNVSVNSKLLLLKFLS